MLYVNWWQVDGQLQMKCVVKQNVVNYKVHRREHYFSTMPLSTYYCRLLSFQAVFIITLKKKPDKLCIKQFSGLRNLIMPN